MIPTHTSSIRQHISERLLPALPVRNPKAGIQEAVEEVAARLFRQGQPALVAHHRRLLAAYFTAMFPSASAWADYCRSFQPDATIEQMDRHLDAGIKGWETFKPDLKQKLRDAFRKECKHLRLWADLLLGWVERNENVIDTASPETLAEMADAVAHVARAQEDGYLVLTRERNDDGQLVERVTDGHAYAIITHRHEHLGMTIYEKPRRCFTYQTPQGEHGAVPYSEVTHFKAL